MDLKTTQQQTQDRADNGRSEDRLAISFNLLRNLQICIH